MSKTKWLYLETFLANIGKEFKQEGYKFLGEGAFRAVYRKPGAKTILKIPTNDSGISCNYIEDLMYKKFKYMGILAKCSLSHYKRIPILKMEFIISWRDVMRESNLPAWAKKVDGKQVGLNSKGKLLCYDYANNWDIIQSEIHKINMTSHW